MVERVRWADVDLVGIMRYSAYTRILEAAESELFRAIGFPYDAVFDGFDVWLPRKLMTVEYHAPARLDDELLVHTHVSRIGTTSLTMRFDVRGTAPHTRYASAVLVMVCVDRRNFAKQPLPAALVRALQPHVVEG
jgi:YbgC/YbaW family acyl-CoA thioester hydrolase